MSDSSNLDKLERQIERGSFFTHSALSNKASRIHEVEFFLYALADVLISKGITTSDELQEAAQRVRQEMVQKGEALGAGIALRIDGDEKPESDFVPVNCPERLHICKAICCSLTFALSPEEIESGKTKWDLGQPYYIRQEANGCCTHIDPETKGCKIYQDRPRVCRKYSCAKDERIWNNFEKMELNDEWIEKHLGDSKMRLATAFMHRIEVDSKYEEVPPIEEGQSESKSQRK
ncbi:MAG TPA: hypothetical protein DEG17_17400 [Cyanobacteria bacterium UBA11149]|nr:hypothetical protein [Cyanobacteria bacterium UBA11367]HBE59376.1 hypothetical protein [Cyanobacteria bacterium UBA11366]HBK62743.1 hypothetical protein [Cyanobacteria bacterium UBA11166]HBR73495.1 hypothetical protein [Cyanobacteria bacterium UBA11159]HBS71828.1 hypothetical protein [Cyanobacteria bacterium UBA11153]HBW90598.1 hypothetical protein [Cyanobacteria bacterium UBA11149]HCA94244.1 hypothetical protein [Cyanobacteria bacterium UBA9226]